MKKEPWYLKKWIYFVVGIPIFLIFLFFVVGIFFTAIGGDKSEKELPATTSEITTTMTEEPTTTSVTEEITTAESTTERPTQKATQKATEKPVIVTEPVDTTPREFKNALQSAENYLEYTAFSKEGLKDQLKYEKFSDDAIAYAIENITADWKENAVRAAKDYLKFSPMSKDELYEQLIYEKYTEEEARYAVEVVY